MSTEQSTAVDRVTGDLPAEREEPETLLGVIARAVTNPAIDVEKMERILAMQERIMADQRKREFFDAMSRLQLSIPQIEKRGENTHTHTRYAEYEDIDKVLRPLLADEGFSVAFNELDREGALVRFVLRISHRSGHHEDYHLTLTTDEAAKNSQGRATRTPTQSDGSTAAYARRYLLKLGFNIVERGEDNDGNGPEITPDQAQDLRALMSEVGADEKRFLKFFKAGSIEAIPAARFNEAIRALEAKRK